MKLKTQILVIALGLAASTSLVWSADSTVARSKPGNRGRVARNQIWGQLNESRGSPFPALRTFYRDGNTTAYANAPGPGPLDTPEAGVWQREPGSHNYSYHDISYFYDENGAFAGSGQVTTNVHLTSANSFTQRHDPGLRR